MKKSFNTLFVTITTMIAVASFAASSSARADQSAPSPDEQKSYLDLLKTYRSNQATKKQLKREIAELKKSPQTCDRNQSQVSSTKPNTPESTAGGSGSQTGAGTIKAGAVTPPSSPADQQNLGYTPF